MSIELSNNKRIAKNTAFLYVRMLLMMVVSLYTSRVIFNVLGVTDFGIYNVVGGVVAMLGFLNSAMSNAVQRFLSFEIGSNNKFNITNVFNVSVIIHCGIAFFIFVLLEFIGVWYLENYINIPSGRMDAAHWVLQCAILSTMVTIIQVPYNAMIIAKEQMNIYAYISIFDVILKLLVVYLLLIGGYDRLKMMSLLNLSVTILIGFVYIIYCIYNYREIKFCKIKSWKIVRELSVFAGWNMFGEIAWAFCGQGVNMILNLFFGPSVNAARAIAEQVNATVMRFISSFQTAVNPQLIKTYAANQLDEMKLLLFRSTRFSYYLLFVISLPLILCMDTILYLWLGDVPEYTTSFCQLVLICSLTAVISNLLAQVARAYGKIRKYQLVVSFVIFLNFPLSYMVLKMGASPLVTMMVNIILQIALIFIRLFLVKNMIMLSIVDFVKDVIFPIIKVTFLSSIIPILLFLNFNVNSSNTLILCLVSIISVLVVSYWVGMSKDERIYVNCLIDKYKAKFR